jgi:hypothetical protein
MNFIQLEQAYAPNRRDTLAARVLREAGCLRSAAAMEWDPAAEDTEQLAAATARTNSPSRLGHKGTIFIDDL